MANEQLIQATQVKLIWHPVSGCKGQEILIERNGTVIKKVQAGALNRTTNVAITIGKTRVTITDLPKKSRPLIFEYEGKESV
jgi:hypothetical protein